MDEEKSFMVVLQRTGKGNQHGYVFRTLAWSVEHNSLWETLALFINTNREENTRHSVEYFCFLLFLDFFL